MFDDDDPLLIRLRGVVLGFPGAEEYVSHGRPNFRVKKNFAVFGGGEKIDGGHRRVDAALLVKVEESEREALDPDPRFFSPMYYGSFGWLALELADPQTAWVEVAEAVDACYRLTAPERVTDGREDWG